MTIQQPLDAASGLARESNPAAARSASSQRRAWATFFRKPTTLVFVPLL